MYVVISRCSSGRSSPSRPSCSPNPEAWSLFFRNAYFCPDSQEFSPSAWNDGHGEKKCTRLRWSSGNLGSYHWGGLLLDSALLCRKRREGHAIHLDPCRVLVVREQTYILQNSRQFSRDSGASSKVGQTVVSVQRFCTLNSMTSSQLINLTRRGGKTFKETESSREFHKEH